MIASDLITLALKIAGVTSATEPAQAQDLSDGLLLLNAMLSQWQRRRFLIWRLADLACPSTGAQSYMCGPDADASGFATALRPDRIEAAYARRFPTWSGSGSGFAEVLAGSSEIGDDSYASAQLTDGTGAAADVIAGISTGQTLDFPLRVISSREDYARISMKALATWPAAVFYDPAYPDGQLYFWPIPQAGQWELHILVKQVLQQCALADVLNTPPEYIEALSFNLARRMRPMYGLPPDPSVESMATSSLSTLRAANADIPAMRLPGGLAGGGGVYWPGLEIGGGGSSSFGIGSGGIGIDAL